MDSLRAYFPLNHEELPEGTIVKLRLDHLSQENKDYYSSKGVTEDSLGVIYYIYKKASGSESLMVYEIVWKTPAEPYIYDMNWDEITSTGKYILPDELKLLKINPGRISEALKNTQTSPPVSTSKVSKLRAMFERRQGGGKRGRKSRKYRKVRKSRKVLKSRKVRKSRRRSRR